MQPSTRTTSPARTSAAVGRLGDIADMADVVVFLASDGARFITGAGIPVDGGMGT